MEDNIWHTMYPWFLFQWVGNWATQTVWKVSSFLKTLGYIKSEIDHRSTLKLWNLSKMSIFQTWRMGWNGFLIYREFTRNGLHFHFVGTSLSGSKVHDVPKRPVNRPITVLFVPPPLQKKTLISQVKTLQKFETATKSSFATNLWPSMTIKPQLVLWFYAFSNFSPKFPTSHRSERLQELRGLDNDIHGFLAHLTIWLVGLLQNLWGPLRAWCFFL